MAASHLEVRLSRFAQPFMVAAIDLLKAVRLADECGEDLPDEVTEAAGEFERVIDEGRGEL
jgi:hypothetical protein